VEASVVDGPAIRWVVGDVFLERAQRPAALREGHRDPVAEAVGLFVAVGERAREVLADRVGLLSDEGFCGGVADVAVVVPQACRDPLDDALVVVLGEPDKDLALFLRLEGIDLTAEHVEQDLNRRIFAFEVIDQAHREGEVGVFANPLPDRLGHNVPHAQEQLIDVLLLLGVLHPVLVGHVEPVE
jgi:hypothetical protein